MNKNTKNIFYEYFEKLAPNYNKYRKKFHYYWNDISEYCDFYIQESDSVLEIGCGTGLLLSKLKGKEKTGIDFSPAMIKEAKKNFADIDFYVQDAQNITLNKKFDVIILANVIGYFNNLIDVFESIKKLCHRRTKIIIAYYNFLWEPILHIAEFIGFKNKSPKQNWLSKKDIENILYLTGFDPFRSTRRIIFPFYIPLLSEFLNKFVAKLPLINLLSLNQYVNARPVFFTNNDWKQKYSVSVIIPARNESGNIENAIIRLPKMGKHTEIIFIEGNSNDDTWEKIQWVQKKYINKYDIKIAKQDGKGKGDAVRKGFSIATGDILMILDADLTVPPEDLPKFYKAIATGKGEFINGSRLVYPMEKNAMRFLNILGNKFFSIIFSWLLEQNIKDTLCGTKVIFKEDYEKLKKNRSYFGNFDPFGDFDLLFGAYKLNLKIIDLPIRYQQRTYGDTNISRFKHGLLLFKMCIYASKKIKFW